MIAPEVQTTKFNFEGQEIVINGFGSEYVFEKIHAGQNFYELALLTALSDLLAGKEGCIVDAGANLGNHSIFFGGILGRQVISFEPNAENYELLKRNVAANGLEELVELHSVFLGASAGITHIAQAIEGNRGTFSESPDGLEVNANSLDQIVGEKKVAGIKIDVEGAEVGVLQGALKTIARDRPVLSVETHGLTSRLSVSKVLVPLGYRLVDVKGPSDNLCWIHNDDPRHEQMTWQQVVHDRREQERRHYSLSGTLRRINASIAKVQQGIDDVAESIEGVRSHQTGANPQTSQSFAFELGSTLAELRHSNERLMRSFGELSRDVSENWSTVAEEIDRSSQETRDMLSEHRKEASADATAILAKIKDIKASDESVRLQTLRRQLEDSQKIFQLTHDAFVVVARELEEVHPLGWTATQLDGELKRLLKQQNLPETWNDSDSSLVLEQRKNFSKLNPTNDQNQITISLGSAIGPELTPLQKDLLQKKLGRHNIAITEKSDQGISLVPLCLDGVDAKEHELETRLAESNENQKTAYLLHGGATEDELWNLARAFEQVAGKAPRKMLLFVEPLELATAPALTAVREWVRRGIDLDSRNIERIPFANRDGIYVGKIEEIERNDFNGVPSENWIRFLRRSAPEVSIVASCDSEESLNSHLDVDEIWLTVDPKTERRLQRVLGAFLFGSYQEYIAQICSPKTFSAPIFTPLDPSKDNLTAVIPGINFISVGEVGEVLTQISTNESYWTCLAESRTAVWESQNRVEGISLATFIKEKESEDEKE